jgi:hypothetical protein
VTDVLIEIDPKIRAKVDRLVAEVGEERFRRGVAKMTRWNIEAMSLDDVIALYVLAREGRVRPPEQGRKAAVLHMTLPPRTDDDAGFSDSLGRAITRDEWLRRRAERPAAQTVA